MLMLLVYNRIKTKTRSRLSKRQMMNTGAVASSSASFLVMIFCITSNSSKKTVSLTMSLTPSCMPKSEASTQFSFVSIRRCLCSCRRKPCKSKEVVSHSRRSRRTSRTKRANSIKTYLRTVQAQILSENSQMQLPKIYNSKMNTTTYRKCSSNQIRQASTLTIFRHIKNQCRCKIQCPMLDKNLASTNHTSKVKEATDPKLDSLPQ